MLKTAITGATRLKNQLKFLELPPTQKKRVLIDTGRRVQRQARARLRSQTDIEGRSYRARKSTETRRKGKMLKRLGKPISYRRDGENTIRVGHNNPVTARIAFAHQRGINETMTVKKMEKIHGNGFEKPATRKQAKALIAEGYKLRVPGKKPKRASLKSIINNMTRGQAGIVLRTMRNGGSYTPGKQSWNLPGTPRSFLGANQNEVNEMVEAAFNHVLNKVKTARA